MTREELITALETATGPCRELDAQIAMAAGIAPAVAFRPCVSPDPGTFGVGAYDTWVAPLYTASVDAALMLVPEGFCWEVRKGYVPEATVWQIGCEYDEGSGRTLPHAQAPTPAIALCIAALRARP